MQRWLRAAGTPGEEADQVHVDLEKVGHLKPRHRVLSRSSFSLLMYLEAPRTERCFSRTAMHLPCMHVTLVYLASQRRPIAHSQQPGERLMSCPYGSAILSAEATPSLVCYRIKSLSKMLRRWSCTRLSFPIRQPRALPRPEGRFPFLPPLCDVPTKQRGNHDTAHLRFPLLFMHGQGSTTPLCIRRA